MKTREITDKEYEAVVEPLRQRKAAYQSIPQAVVDDLAKFCRADISCWHSDPRIHAALEGRREVWLRIQQHRTMTPEQLAALYRSTVPDVVEEEKGDE